MNDPCPGSGFDTGHRRTPQSPTPCYATCPYCLRSFAVTTAGRLRKHQGLPIGDDGGCPYYHCPPSCDFACYAKESA